MSVVSTKISINMTITRP